MATGSADSTVKVWDTATGALLATLRGGSSNAILSCDICNGVIVGGGSDKTCRVWNLKTQRMVKTNHVVTRHLNKPKISFLDASFPGPPLGRSCSQNNLRTTF